MKVLIGTDIGSYTFDAANQTITFNDLPTLTLDQILLVTNVTTGTIIYNFATSSAIGSIQDNVLTLAYDTTDMSNTDKLQIWIYAAVEQTSDKNLYYTNNLLTKIVDGNMQTVLTYSNGILTRVTKSLKPDTSGTIGEFIIGETFVIGG